MAPNARGHRPGRVTRAPVRCTALFGVLLPKLPPWSRAAVVVPLERPQHFSQALERQASKVIEKQNEAKVGFQSGKQVTRKEPANTSAACHAKAEIWTCMDLLVRSLVGQKALLEVLLPHPKALLAVLN